MYCIVSFWAHLEAPLKIIVDNKLWNIWTYINCFCDCSYLRSRFSSWMCKQPLESLSFSKVICLYAWQDSLGTPRWCVGTVPCSRKSRHFLPAAPWCSSLSPSATGSMPSWAAIIHWRRSTNGTPRGASLSHLRSWISRHLEHFLWFPLTTGCSFSHPASREKHRYMST